ncbi:site-specific DNA-methyltransferase [Mammaliicoccus sp. O-M54]|uniref:DNA-methyltransferase n=1 Tax=Mammaliicoccus sp. O-M54 TaxID=2898713 RepID=UPI001EFB5EA2|nr:site-specific DNA-methyltransferase [Mammaliicoccus sp. O-M54]
MVVVQEVCFKKKIVNTGRIFKHNTIDIEEYIEEFYRILKPSSHCYIMTNNKNISNFLKIISETKFHFIKNLIWVKDNKIMGQTYMSQFEYVIMLRKGKHKKINHCGTSDVINIPNKKMKDKNNKTIHDTEKPVKLNELLIENSSHPGDLIFDPFIGIGSSAIAAINTNRNYIGFELDEEYYKTSIERINNHKKDKQTDLFEVLDNGTT